MVVKYKPYAVFGKLRMYWLTEPTDTKAGISLGCESQEDAETIINAVREYHSQKHDIKQLRHCIDGLTNAVNQKTASIYIFKKALKRITRLKTPVHKETRAIARQALKKEK